MVIIEREDFGSLLTALKRRGYTVVGPTVRDGAIVYDELAGDADLPIGWTDEQEGGTYRLKRRQDKALFGYVVGPHSWKKFLFPTIQKLFSAHLTKDGFEIDPDVQEPVSHISQPTSHIPKFAFIGVRSCELHAIAVQDRVFLNGTFVNSSYKARRESVFIIAANCGQAGGTCFCVSMKTGPKVTFGFDLALTEVIGSKRSDPGEGRHYFVVEVGSERGAEVLAEIKHEEASHEEKETAERIVATTSAQMGRTMDTTDIKELLYRNYENQRWNNVASRCLTCGNCTMVCPTCFCTTVEDVTDLSGQHAERWQKWDSCFTMDFSYIHGGSVRSSPKARYRQWMTHKLGTWIDQFGASGCVGCGRCITWCPVAIDITEEVAAIRASEVLEKETTLVKEK